MLNSRWQALAIARSCNKGATPCACITMTQALLRGVASGPRPSDYLPTAARSPTDPLRRLVIIDENVERIYGTQLRRVSSKCYTRGVHLLWNCSVVCGGQRSPSGCHKQVHIYKMLLCSARHCDVVWHTRVKYGPPYMHMLVAAYRYQGQSYIGVPCAQ